MSITINEIMFATEPAHDATKHELILSENSQFTEEDDLWDTDETNPEKGLVYYPLVQKIFDGWYDYFYDMIIKVEEKV